ncbi:MAG: MmcQ/YjbR family DNA-binding protein [Oscillospiraceae bacterium]|nr:MmcQ/YjbR family DNA-binding protein [Oscillospiraceae bacterium]
MFEWFDAYARSKPGVTSYFKEGWNWQRYFVGDKLFADVGKTGEDGEICFVTLRCTEEEISLMRQSYRAAAPGFYTDKKRNLTIWTDPDRVPERDRTPGAAEDFPPEETVRFLTDKAYAAAFSKLTKTRQREIGGETAQKKGAD